MRRKTSETYTVEGLRLVQRNGNWHIYGSIDGVQYRRSTRKKDFLSAKRALDTLHAEFLSGWRTSGKTKCPWISVAREIYNRQKYSATFRGIPFRLKASQVYELMRETDFRCAVSGIPFSNLKGLTGEPDPWAPSIDRIENREGYTEGNVRIVAVCANLAMNRFGYDVLLRLSKGIVASSKLVASEPIIVTSRPSGAAVPADRSGGLRIPIRSTK